MHKKQCIKNNWPSQQRSPTICKCSPFESPSSLSSKLPQSSGCSTWERRLGKETTLHQNVLFMFWLLFLPPHNDMHLMWFLFMKNTNLVPMGRVLGTNSYKEWRVDWSSTHLPLKLIPLFLALFGVTQNPALLVWTLVPATVHSQNSL